VTPDEDAVMRTAKEIIIKFIEAGKVSPTTFDKIFKDVTRSVSEALAEVVRGKA